MAKLSKAVVAVMLASLLTTQTGCVTQALLRMGEPPPGGARDQPVDYARAVRNGGVIGLEYESSISADGTVFKHGTDRVRVDLAGATWHPLWGAPMDPSCSPGAWYRISPDAPPEPVPLLRGRIMSRPGLAELHKRVATGSPPMSVHLQDLDAWIVCGAGDNLTFTEVPAPPPPQSGERSTGTIVAIALLFPLALAVDIAGGLFYVLFLIAGGR